MIQFSDNFTFAKLLRFTLPSIVMLIFTSVYTIVDGFFVSNFAGKAEFTALNFIFPLISILGSFGFLFGTGGGAGELWLSFRNRGRSLNRKNHG